MIESVLRKFLESRRSRVIVIIGTFGIGLATVLPLADEYLALRDRREHLKVELSGAQQAAKALPRFEKRVHQQIRTLENWQSQTVPAGQVHEFRRSVVDLVRETGCQIRRVHTDAAHTRPWSEGDDPLKVRNVRSKKKDDSHFELTSQSFVLEISGTLPQIEAVLSQLHREGKLAHTRHFVLRPVGRNRKEVVLELELLLFDLTRKTNTSA